MRIAIVHPYPAKPALEEAASSIIYRDRALGSLLVDLGHTVKGFRTTETPGQRSGAVRSPDPFLDWFYYPVDERSRAVSRARMLSPALSAALAEWQPDFVLIKGIGTAIGIELLERSAVPMGAIIGGNHTERQLAKTDVILTENPEQERYLARRMGHSPLIRLPKLVSPVFMDDTVEDPLFDIAVIGKFEAHKNHETLKPLFDHELSIVLVGDGSLRSDLEEYSRGRVATVAFPGFVGTDEVAKILKKSRVLVHPSLSEGFPRAVVEAMASGTPSICIRGVVGWPLEDGVNSLLVSPNELVPRTLELLADGQALQRLSSGAVETFAREFSIERLREAAAALERKMTGVMAQTRLKRQLTRTWQTTRFRVVDGPRVVYRGVRRKAASVLRSVKSDSPQ